MVGGGVDVGDGATVGAAIGEGDGIGTGVKVLMIAILQGVLVAVAVGVGTRCSPSTSHPLTASSPKTRAVANINQNVCR